MQSQRRWVEMWAAVRAQEGEINVLSSPESGWACLGYSWESPSLSWRNPETTDFEPYVRIHCRILEISSRKILFSKLLLLLCIVKGQEKKNPFDSFALVA